jgi:NAD(P) transhydrogenase
MPSTEGSPAPFDLVIIGSGPAGQQAAIEAARHGRRVAIVEKQLQLGGVCLHTGTMPSKSLREAVLNLTGWSRRRVSRRWQAGSPEQFDMTELSWHIDQVIAKELAVIGRRMSHHGIALYYGCAHFLDDHRIAVDSSEGPCELVGQHILIASGTKARRPGDIPFCEGRVIDSDQLCAIAQLPKSMAILGSGVIALEYASILSLLGVTVHVIYRGSSVLSFLDGDMTDILVRHLTERGVLFHASTEPRSYDLSRPSGVELQLTDGSSLETDLVMVALGRSGATEELDLTAAGLSVDQRGLIPVDDSFATAVPHIYAAGDIIGQPATASTAKSEGISAAGFICGAGSAGTGAPLLPYGVYTVPEIGYVGQTEEALRHEGIPYHRGIARYNELAKGEIIGDELGLTKILFHRETEKVLGVHIIGSGATDLIQLGHAVMSLEGTVGYFTESVFNYPSLSEGYKVAAQNAALAYGTLGSKERRPSP